MVAPTQEAIDTFISITGAPDAVARQRLEEHGGNLNEAVNSYFNEADRNIVNEAPSEAPENDYMEVDDVGLDHSHGQEFPQFPSSRNLNPFSLLDGNLRRSFLGRHFDLENFFPIVSHPREVREIPIEVKDDRPHGSGQSVLIEDVTGNVDDNGSEIFGNVTFDDDDDDSIPTGSGFRTSPNLNNSFEEETYIESEMIQAAIEASKQEVEEQAKTLEEHEKKSEPSGSKLSNPVKIEILDNSPTSSKKQDTRSTSEDDFEVIDERPLIRRKSRNKSSASVESAKVHKNVEIKSPPRSPQHHDISDHSCRNGNAFHLDEWGGISSEEHDEAVMLEAAIFGVMPGESGYNFPYTSHQFSHTSLNGPESSYNWQIPRPPSPSLQAQRIIREQQDDEYLASLQADQEKETKAKKDAEAHHLMELAAKEATLKEEKMKEEESHRKAVEEKEREGHLAVKQASLPREPEADEENSVTLLVRMPDGTRRGRRFLKSDRLQNLFDFVDVGGGVKIGSYRLVRPYPRRAMGGEEGGLTLEEAGLCGRQEALFLELI